MKTTTSNTMTMAMTAGSVLLAGEALHAVTGLPLLFALVCAVSAAGILLVGSVVTATLFQRPRTPLSLEARGGLAVMPISRRARAAA